MIDLSNQNELLVFIVGIITMFIVGKYVGQGAVIVIVIAALIIYIGPQRILGSFREGFVNINGRLSAVSEPNSYCANCFNDETIDHVYNEDYKYPSSIMRNEDQLIERFEQIDPLLLSNNAVNYTGQDSNFTDTYWEQAAFAEGILPGTEAELHFDEGVGYYGNEQMPQFTEKPGRRPKEPVWRRDKQDSQCTADELFDINDRYSAQVADPRTVVMPSNGLYKGQTYGDDEIDYMTRRRNERHMMEAQRGSMSVKAREIYSEVFAAECGEGERRQWWSNYEN